MHNISAIIKGIAEDRVTRYLPERILAVAIDPDRQSAQHTADVTVLASGCRTTHGPHVYHIRSLVVCDPQATVFIFRNTFAGITAPPMRIRQGGGHKREAVVTHGTTAIGGDPDETLAVNKKLVNVVVRKTCREVERSHLIMLCQHILR